MKPHSQGNWLSRSVQTYKKHKNQLFSDKSLYFFHVECWNSLLIGSGPKESFLWKDFIFLPSLFSRCIFYQVKNKDDTGFFFFPGNQFQLINAAASFRLLNYESIFVFQADSKAL